MRAAELLNDLPNIRFVIIGINRTKYEERREVIKRLQSLIPEQIIQLKI
jgi:hypothetical protein